MARPKKPTKDAGLFSGEDFEKKCISYLHENGYAIFKADDIHNIDEAECVRKLRMVGYRVEHIRDSLVKVDTEKIISADDIVLYFYEFLKRYNRSWFDPDKLSNKEHRKIDCSVVNSYLRWRVDSGDIALNDAMKELFLLIDTLFEKANEWGIEVRGIGILSINTNKSFVMSLLREANLKKDNTLEYEVEVLINEPDKVTYLNLLDKAKKEMRAATRPIKTRRKKISLR